MHIQSITPLVAQDRCRGMHGRVRSANSWPLHSATARTEHSKDPQALSLQNLKQGQIRDVDIVELI